MEALAVQRNQMKKKITVAGLAILSTTITLAGFLLTYDKDYRWIGHAVAGTAALGFLGSAIVAGATLAGSLRRPAGPDGYKRHRDVGIAFGIAVVISMAYGLWVVISLRLRVLSTVHGWLGIAIVVLCLTQILPSLVSKSRRQIKRAHRLVGFTLGGFMGIQVLLGLVMVPGLLFSLAGERIYIPWITPMEFEWKADGVIHREGYHTVRVMDNGNYELYYRSDGTYIYIAIKARTTGWAGVGIGAGEGMKNASITWGYVKDGQAFVEDAHGTGRFEHRPDTELGETDDILEFGGSEENGWTIIEFKRPIVSEDKYDLPLIPGKHMVIWAYGPDDGFSMHTARGYLDVEVEP